MTINEIARLAGVSISTVSKVVNNKAEAINPQTRSRVLQIVKEYNYTPYSAIKANGSGKTFLLGVLVRDADRSSLMISGILNAAQQRGYTILLLSSGSDRDLEAKHLTALCRHKVDGVLWEPACPESLPSAADLTRQDIPFFLLGTDKAQAGGGAVCFNYDYSLIGYLLCKNLLSCDHTAIGLYLDPALPQERQLLDGVKKCLYDHRIEYHSRMLLSGDPGSCLRSMELLNMTGVICGGYRSALKLSEHLRRMNYSIPADYSLLALKTGIRCADFAADISGISLPEHGFGSFAADALMDYCEKISDTPASGLFSGELSLDHTYSLSRPHALRSGRCIVVGSINTDMTFHVDFLPQSGKTTQILSSRVEVGGKGANEAVGLARLGHCVSLIGETGNDADATFIFDTLVHEGVDTTGVRRQKDQATGTAYIYTEPNGESAISILAGANAALTPEVLRTRSALFRDAACCLISSEIPAETVAEAARLARRSGLITFLKPATLQAEALPALAEYIDFFIPNRKEASLLCPACKSVGEQAAHFIALGFKTVIITLGHRGCYLKTSDQEKTFPAGHFTPVDTTGGADAFIAALASFLVRGERIEKAILAATCAAGFCIERQGVVPALIDKNTLDNYILRETAG